MGKVCILTDNSAQFPHHTFRGQDYVRIIPHDIYLNDAVHLEGKDIKINDLPLSANLMNRPALIPPSIEKFTHWFNALGQESREIIVLLQSSHLSEAYLNACQAADDLKGSLTIQVINSQTTSAGLGILTQIAAEAVDDGANLVDIEHTLRKQVSHIYTVFCTPGLSYLYQAGVLDKAQAVVGEMLNFLTVFSFEEERLTPVEKIRSYRNSIDFFLEFMEEFEDLRHIALIQSNPPLLPETRTLRQALQEIYTKATYTEHKLNLPLAAIFGPRAIGLIVVENPI